MTRVSLSLVAAALIDTSSPAISTAIGRRLLRSGPPPLLNLGGRLSVVYASETVIGFTPHATAAWIVASRLPARGESVRVPTVLLLGGSSGVGKIARRPDRGGLLVSLRIVTRCLLRVKGPE